MIVGQQQQQCIGCCRGSASDREICILLCRAAIYSLTVKAARGVLDPLLPMLRITAGWLTGYQPEVINYCTSNRSPAQCNTEDAIIVLVLHHTFSLATSAADLVK